MKKVTHLAVSVRLEEQCHTDSELDTSSVSLTPCSSTVSAAVTLVRPISPTIPSTEHTYIVGCLLESDVFNICQNVRYISDTLLVSHSGLTCDSFVTLLNLSLTAYYKYYICYKFYRYHELKYSYMLAFKSRTLAHVVQAEVRILFTEIN